MKKDPFDNASFALGYRRALAKLEDDLVYIERTIKLGRLEPDQVDNYRGRLAAVVDARDAVLRKVRGAQERKSVVIPAEQEWKP